MWIQTSLLKFLTPQVKTQKRWRDLRIFRANAIFQAKNLKICLMSLLIPEIHMQRKQPLKNCVGL